MAKIPNSGRNPAYMFFALILLVIVPGISYYFLADFAIQRFNIK
jgi:phosphotransferase system  glucose/maltose/N-acetylglucosamine-specific IIC component